MPSVMAKRTALISLLLLAALPAAADARNFKVDGRVTGPPTANRTTVTVPLQLTKRAGKALKLGTRRVRVRFRRARLPVSGAAGRSRLAPRALRAGDRLKGVTSLSRKTRRRLRYHARPTLKLRRTRVIRRGRRKAPLVLAPPVAPAARTPEQVVQDIRVRVTVLSGRIGTLGSLASHIARLEALALPVGLAGVTAAFQALTAALEERTGTEPAFEALLAEVEALAPGTEWLGTAMGAIDTAVRSWQTLAMIGDSVETLTVSTMALDTHIGLIEQIPGMLTQLIAIDDALARIESRLGAVEAGSDAIGSATGELNPGMASLTASANELATATQGAADPASLGPGVDALATDVGAVAHDFAALQTGLDQLGPALDGLNSDAVQLTALVEALEALGLGGG
jgi:hypothetical protein